MASFQLTVQTAIRGYHIYMDVWTSTIGENFNCNQERQNDADKYTVVVILTNCCKLLSNKRTKKSNTPHVNCFMTILVRDTFPVLCHVTKIRVA